MEQAEAANTDGIWQYARPIAGGSMRIIGIGQVIFALSVAALGILSLGSGDFALNWQPVPKDIPGREILATVSGAILFFGGLGLLFKPVARLAALVLTINFFVWLLLLRLPNLVAGWSHEGVWLGFGETLLVVTGAWAILVALQDERDGHGLMGFLAGSTGLRLARLLYGIALPMIGLSHFVYLEATVSLIPSYLPHPEFFAWLTGAGHIAAGFAVLFGVLPRLASVLEGIMMALFAAMVWAPKVVAHPGSRFLWTAFLISVVMAAAAQAIAETYKDWALRPAKTAKA